MEERNSKVEERKLATDKTFSCSCQRRREGDSANTMCTQITGTNRIDANTKTHRQTTSRTRKKKIAHTYTLYTHSPWEDTAAYGHTPQPSTRTIRQRGLKEMNTTGQKTRNICWYKRRDALMQRADDLVIRQRSGNNNDDSAAPVANKH